MGRPGCLPPGRPGGVRRRDRGAGSCGPPEITVSRLVEERDVVVAEGTVRNALQDGSVLSVVYCDVFLVRDGRIRQLTSYLMPVT